MAIAYSVDQFKSDIIAEKQYKGNRKTTAIKAAEIASNWWNAYGHKVYKTNIRMNTNESDIKRELYEQCYEHTIANFTGGLLAYIIIQAIVSFVVRRLLEKLLEQAYNDSEIIRQSVPESGILKSVEMP